MVVLSTSAYYSNVISESLRAFYYGRRQCRIMGTTNIPAIIAHAVRACWLDKTKDRQISLRRLREASGKPNTVEGLADTLTEAKTFFEALKAQGIVTWYGVFNLNGNGPEWIRFQIPPYYARSPNAPAALDSAADGE